MEVKEVMTIESPEIKETIEIPIVKEDVEGAIKTTGDKSVMKQWIKEIAGQSSEAKDVGPTVVGAS